MTHPCQPMVALIPARAGSKRVPGKNTKLLHGQPLIAYAIAAAQQSGVFAHVCVCSDDPLVFQFVCTSGVDYGVSYLDRPPVPDDQPDIVWVRAALNSVGVAILGRQMSFAILRPTSPFRTAETIRRAYAQFTLPDQTADSVRAVEPASQSPYKMWTQAGYADPIKPLLQGNRADGVPYHSCPTQSAPLVYVQNSSLEMGWTSNVEMHGTIHGRKVAPFFTQGYEGFAIDTLADWREAEYLIASGEAVLPTVESPLTSLT